MNLKYSKKNVTPQSTLFLPRSELSLREGLVFSCFTVLSTSLMIISIWSLLLTIGSTSGEGPLGAMVRYALVITAKLSA